MARAGALSFLNPVGVPLGYTFGFVYAYNGTRQMEAGAEMLCAS